MVKVLIILILLTVMVLSLSSNYVRESKVKILDKIRCGNDICDKNEINNPGLCPKDCKDVE